MRRGDARSKELTSEVSSPGRERGAVNSSAKLWLSSKMGFKRKPPFASSKRLPVRGRRRLGLVDANNRRALQVNNGMDLNGHWRNDLSAESRQKIVNKITTVLQRHMPPVSFDGLSELRKIAVRFEEKTYIAAASQHDYLQKISLKMLLLETRVQGFATRPLAPNRPVGGN